MSPAVPEGARPSMTAARESSRVAPNWRASSAACKTHARAHAARPAEPSISPFSSSRSMRVRPSPRLIELELLERK
jgi:hypothetical protein